MSSMQKMMRQAQKLQQELEKAQKELAVAETTHKCQGVEVVVKGDMALKSISIAPELLTNPDREMLQDILLLAVNGGLAEVKKKNEERMAGLTGGLSIPGLV